MEGTTQWAALDEENASNMGGRVALNFRHKVFLSYFLNSLVTVVCMLVIGSYFAHRNFENYVHKVEMEGLNERAAALIQEYRKENGWESVLKHWPRWSHPAAMRHAGVPPIPPPPPPPDPARKNSLVPGRHAPFDAPIPHMEPPPEFHAIAPRIVLFDDQKRPLSTKAMTSTQEYDLIPLTVAKQRIGWLGTRKRKRPTHPLDLEFIRHQSLTFYSTGGVALILALFMTVILSQHILKPVKRLEEGTRALISRKFDTRIEIKSRDELGQLSADFNTMAQTLERYEQMRQQWIADIAHELRTPLAILRAEIEAMQDGVREVNRNALDSLQFEVMQMSRIVHDLHELSLIESQAFEKKQQVAVQIWDVLESTLRSFRTRFEKRGIVLSVDDLATKPVTIMGEADRLRQLFSNLLENTLRYAQAPGKLRISSEISPGSVILSFEDSGPGVPEASIDRLFDRLYRVDKARSRAHGGSGLGLAICKSIVECFAGRIEASNGRCGGLCITMVFPTVTK